MSRLWWLLGLCVLVAAISSRACAYVDVVKDCPGIIGDGTTDDWAALQNCLNSHPSEHIVLPHGRYHSSRPLVLMGNSQWLQGEAPAQYVGPTKLIFSIDSVGIQIPPTCYACKLTDLEIDSAACPQGPAPIWTGPLNGAGVDGIQVGGGEPYLANVRAACFTRHGIHITGDRSIFPDQPGVALNEPDFWRLDDVAAYWNGGDGVFITGADSNAGVGDLVIATGNGLWGVDDNSMLGNNAWNMIGTHANRTGTIRSRAGAPSSTFIDPYCEMGQGSSQIQGRSMVIGGNCADSETNWQAPFLTVAGLTFNVYSQGGMNINSP